MDDIAIFLVMLLKLQVQRFCIFVNIYAFGFLIMLINSRYLKHIGKVALYFKTCNVELKDLLAIELLEKMDMLLDLNYIMQLLNI